MNEQTTTLIQRPYAEIVDDILTAIVGGVVNEPIFFDVKEDDYPLSQPGRDVRGISGTLEGEQHAFQKEVDFVFDEGRNSVVWMDGGSRPDDETHFYVDYFRRNGNPPLTDTNIGSVTRTLSEAIAREIATVYQQIRLAYLSGFVDSAEGKALDLVVSILDIRRKTKEHASGLVTFYRDAAAGDGNVTIPEGILLSTEKGAPSFVTAEQRTLQRGQTRIDVPIRASDASRGDAGIVEGGAITRVSQTITGISRLSNAEATILGSENETDAQLRARAKAALRAAGKGTLAALRQVVFERRGKLTEVWDPNGPPDRRSRPGSLALLVESEPQRFEGLRRGIHETRAAGVEAAVVARFVFLRLRIVVKTSRSLSADGQSKVVSEIIQALRALIEGLSAGQPAQGAQLLEAIQGVEDVAADGTEIVDVMTWQSDVGKPGADDLVDTALAAIAGIPSDNASALRTALADVLSPSAPTERRLPKRDFVRSTANGRAGQPANDEDVEAASFEVVSQVDGAPWRLVLDMEPSDVRVE